jgi:hypothetical protein
MLQYSASGGNELFNFGNKNANLRGLALSLKRPR